MRVTVAIPYREKCKYRARSLPYVMQAYRDLGYEPILVDTDHKEFNRAAARNECARQAGDGVVVIADSDILPNRDALESAVVGAKSGGLHLAYDYYRALTQESSERYYREGGDPSDWPIDYDGRKCTAGIMVMTVDEWWKAGGMDERFFKWGWEDTAFAYACESLLGRKHTYHKGTVNHLWHISEVRVHSASYLTNKKLCNRYMSAKRKPDVMRGITEEWKLSQ